MSQKRNDELHRFETRHAEKLRERLTRIYLDTPKKLDLAVVKKRRWCVVPRQERITPEDAAGIARAAQAHGFRSAKCVTASPDAYVEGFELDLTERALLQFDANCMLREFILAERDERFVILEEGDYYYLLAGSVDFVAAAFREGPEELYEEFETYASADDWPRRMREWLLGVAERYRETA